MIMNINRCFQWFKDTKMKANHNNHINATIRPNVVSSGSKILKWKQITTAAYRYASRMGCFQWFKDTKMKANHNDVVRIVADAIVVSSGSKILKWKQITTWCVILSALWSCFQWFKDTKMKANHNKRTVILLSKGLFPVVQRY